MLELEQARQRILDAIQILEVETVRLADAHRRYLSAPVVSKLDLPTFDNSAMDGYAVRSGDLASATSGTPVALNLAGRIAAGEMLHGEIQPGQCARIFTGSPLPAGADAVAMQEDTQVDPANPGQIHFLDSVKPWENVRFRGEDVKKGATLAEAGTRLNAGHLNLLAACGTSDVQVMRRPTIGILATGNELREPGQSLEPGELFESNRIGIAALIAEAGAKPIIYPLVRDTLDATATALTAAFAECDAVITTGGVSVGELDFVKAAFANLGGTLDFWKISMKPGKPFVFGRMQGKFLFGLPGNPVSALVTCVLLVAPALAKMQGAKNCSWPTHRGVLAEPVENSGDRRHFMRVVIDESSNVRSAGIQASHVLSAFAKANGLLEIPPKTAMRAGDAVSVLRLD